MDKGKFKRAIKLGVSISAMTLAFGTIGEIRVDSENTINRSIELKCDMCYEYKIVFEEKLISEKINELQYEIIPKMNVTYEGNKYAIDVDKVNEMLNETYEGSEKYIFLTFDDGPSPNTERVLGILREKGVHATFFVLGQRVNSSEQSKDILRRTIKNGHAIGNHSYTHSLERLYPGNSIDVDYFMEEVNRTNRVLKEVLGENFDTKIIRMPGGRNSRAYYHDPALPSFDDRLKKEGIVNIDWNALNGDAEGKPYTPTQMLEYVKKSSLGLNQVIVLMHDTYGKEKTVEVLPEIIDYFKANGYEFKTMK